MQKVQKATIFAAVITSFITTFMGSALNLSVPDMSSEFNVSAGAIGWVVTVYMLIAAAFAVPFGRIADLTSRKFVLVSGIAVFGTASLFSVFAGGLLAVIAGRGARGFGASMIFATNHAILISEFDESRRGKVLGYATASTYVGLAAGPVLGGFLNYNFGWRSIFAVNCIVSVIVFVAALVGIPAKNKDTRAAGENGAADAGRKEACGRKEAIDASAAEKKSPDLTGNALFICMILAVIYGLTELMRNKFAPYIATAGIVLGAAFVLRELKTESPVVDVRIFRGNPAYALSNLAALLSYGATYAISYLISIYLQTALGYTSQTAGLILIASPVVMAVLSPLTGKLSDRVSPFLLAAAGMAVTAVSLVIFVFVSEDTSLVVIIGALLLSGLGNALFSSPNTNAVMSCAPAEALGVASSVLATMRSLGHTVSMAIVTIIVTIYIGDRTLAAAEPAALVTTMHTAFIVFAVLSAVGALLSLKRPNSKRSS